MSGLDISATADLAIDLDLDFGIDLNLNANLGNVFVNHVISDWVDLSANTAYLRGSADAFGENTLVNVEFDVVTTDNLSSISVSVISVTD